VERAVIVSRDGVLPNPLHKKQTEPMIPSLHRPRTFPSSMTLEDSDRALIVEMLEQAGWIVGGPRGAAAKLGLKRTTLLAKMRRLGAFSTYPSGRNRRARYSTRDYTTGRCSVLKFVRTKEQPDNPTPRFLDRRWSTARFGECSRHRPSCRGKSIAFSRPSSPPKSRAAA
jgi:hypothetical protein